MSSINPEVLRRSISDADAAAVLETLVTSGELDDERIEDMLFEATAKRLQRNGEQEP